MAKIKPYSNFMYLFPQTVLDGDNFESDLDGDEVTIFFEENIIYYHAS